MNRRRASWSAVLAGDANSRDRPSSHDQQGLAVKAGGDAGVGGDGGSGKRRFVAEERVGSGRGGRSEAPQPLFPARHIPAEDIRPIRKAQTSSTLLVD